MRTIYSVLSCVMALGTLTACNELDRKRREVGDTWMTSDGGTDHAGWEYECTFHNTPEQVAHLPNPEHVCWHEVITLQAMEAEAYPWRCDPDFPDCAVTCVETQRICVW